MGSEDKMILGIVLSFCCFCLLVAIVAGVTQHSRDAIIGACIEKGGKPQDCMLIRDGKP